MLAPILVNRTEIQGKRVLSQGSASGTCNRWYSSRREGDSFSVYPLEMSCLKKKWRLIGIIRKDD